MPDPGSGGRGESCGSDAYVRTLRDERTLMQGGGLVRRLALSVMVVTVLISCPETWAREAVVDLQSRVSIIRSNEGLGRLLVDLAFVDSLACASLQDATLCLQRPALTNPVQIEVHPVSRVWTPTTATWSVPWDSAGGDFTSSVVERLRVNPDPNRMDDLRLDVTRIVRDRLEGGAGASGGYGLIVMPAPSRAEGFPEAMLDSWDGYGKIRLVIVCE